MNSLLWILFLKKNSPWGIHHGEFPMGNSPSGIPQRIPMENSPRWIHHREFTVNLIPRAFFVNSPICLGQRIRFPKGNSPWRILLWWIHVNIPGEFPASFKWTVLYSIYGSNLVQRKYNITEIIIWHSLWYAQLIMNNLSLKMPIWYKYKYFSSFEAGNCVSNSSFKWWKIEQLRRTKLNYGASTTYRTPLKYHRLLESE